MAYDHELADRIREQLGGMPNVTEKAMFGGLAFLVNGNMAVSASGRGGLLLRCDPAQTQKLVNGSTVDRFEMRGKQMDGWLRVDPAAIRTKPQLAKWVRIGVDYAASLPRK
jgi:TfoX/Sxy family transcriptional regulator of competence genes